MKILFLRADVPTPISPLTSTHWLCDVPAKALKRHGVETELRAAGDVYPGHPIMEWADVVVVERNAFFISPVALEVWRKAGKRILLRFDDAYHKLPHWTVAWRDHWGLNYRGKPSIEAFCEHLSYFDSYSTPSKVLTNDFLEYNSNGAYIPNRPDLAELLTPRPFFPKTHYINLVWGGSVPHLESWKMSGAAAAMNRLVKPDKRFTLLFLCERPWFRETFICEYSTLSWAKVDEYRRRLVRFADVGLAPLSGEYDERRSWIKPLVYSALGIPWVASDCAPYKECKGGILVGDNEDGDKRWVRAIRKMIDPQYRLALRQRGMKWAWGQGIDHHIHEWIDWLKGEG